MAAPLAVTEIARAAAKMVADLAACKRRWALVGGLAVSARAEPRNTRDVDIAVAVTDDADAESLVSELMKAGWVVEAAVEQIETGRLATIRLRPPRAKTSSSSRTMRSGVRTTRSTSKRLRLQRRRPISTWHAPLSRRSWLAVVIVGVTSWRCSNRRSRATASEPRVPSAAA